MSTSKAAMSVRELAVHIKNHLESGFQNICVQGEIIGMTRHISGNLYFSLKEEVVRIDCIVWKWKAKKLSFEPKDGTQVLCIGSISTYPDRSKYQLIIDEMQYYGIGEILKMIEERRIKLQNEGIFSQKKAIPKFPNMIGIITSPTGSVIHDMLHRITDRYPCKVLLYPINVQGDKMPSDTIKGIKYLESTSVDLIILARGGGSFSDLIGFNDEAVVRALAGCSKPTISAIGHETDTTLCDYAADLRAPTPTAAIELCTPDRRVLIRLAQDYQSQISFSTARIIQNIRMGLDFEKAYNPKRILLNVYQRLDHLYSGLMNTVKQYLKSKSSIQFHLQRPNIEKYTLTLIQSNKAMNMAVSSIIEKLKLLISATEKALKSMSHEATLKRGFCWAHTTQGTIDTAEKAIKARQFVVQFALGAAEVMAIKKIEK